MAGDSNIPVKDWIRHTKSDSAEYLDAPGISYDEASDEEKALVDEKFGKSEEDAG